MNSKAQEERSSSIVAFEKCQLQLRGEESALSAGACRLMCVDDTVLLQGQSAGDPRLIVALNFTVEPQVAAAIPAGVKAMVSTHQSPSAQSTDSFMPASNEGLVLLAP